MNRRQWKKACKRAAAELERRFPGEHEFVPAEGDEVVCPPLGYVPPGRPRPGLKRRLWRIDFKYDSPPRGTPVLWERSSYEYDEWECRTALDVLADVEFAEWLDSKGTAGIFEV